MSIDKAVDSTQLDADLTSVANAIRTKGGTSAQLAFPAGFVQAIGDIETGGEPEEKDVDFIDYDGTLLYSYTAAEFLAMTEMPPNPQHDGLVAQGWNWTIEDAKEIVEDCGFHVIGQNYTTSDGATRIYITIPENDPLDRMAILCTGAGIENGSLKIDWGDGTIDAHDFRENATVYAYHTYSTRGNFIIRIFDITGAITFGYKGSNNGIVWGNNSEWNAAIKRVTKIEIGDGFTELGTQPFVKLDNLTSVSIPKTCGTTNTTITQFISDSSIRGIVIPNGVTDIGVSNNNYFLQRISLPKTITTIGQQYLYNVKKVLIPDSVTSVIAYTIRNTNRISRLRLPKFVSEYPDYFSSSTGNALAEITVPSAVTKIGAHFMNGSRLLKIHLKPTTPPVLSNTNAFPNLHSSAVFYVPYSADHSILEAYKTASNWSTFASMMQEEPQ